MEKKRGGGTPNVDMLNLSGKMKNWKYKFSKINK